VWVGWFRGPTRDRGEDDDVADNYIVRTYGTGRTAGRYTSSCTPAFF
jgi:hypothetical protein